MTWLLAYKRPFSTDTIIRGLLIGTGIWFVLMIIGVYLSFLVSDWGFEEIAGVSFGLTQWIFLIPLIRAEWSRGYRVSAVSIFLSGLVGAVVAYCSLGTWNWNL